MGKQHLDKHGQPIIVSDRDCTHGVHGDDRGNNACEECLENGLTSSYLLGQVVGVEEASRLLLARAGEAFARGQDKDANMLRELSKELGKLAEVKRADQKKHERDFPRGPPEKES